MSEREVDETIQDLAETRPDYTMDQFSVDFKSIIGRNPTGAEKRNFLKAVKNTKSAKPIETPPPLVSSHPPPKVVEGSSISNVQLASLNLKSKVINGYSFVDVLGKGSFGHVYKCRKDKKEYAVKCIDESLMNAEIEQAFADSISARLNSKFLVRYIDKFRGPSGELYVVMELCQQGDLRKVIDTLRKLNATLNPDRVAKILIQLLLALDNLHTNKILHRDLKAENVFVDKDDNAKLGDFGCAKELDTTSGKAHTLIGTPVYESPQIVKGEEYDSAADMWALGVLLYKLCVLERPFQHANRYKLQELIIAGKYKPVPKGRYPERLVEIIASLLNENPKQRPSARALLQEPFIQKYASELGLLAYFPLPTSMSAVSAIVSTTTATKPVASPTTITKPVASSTAAATTTTMKADAKKDAKSFSTALSGGKGYVFRVALKGGRYGYGRENADVDSVCVLGNAGIAVYLTESDSSTTTVEKKEITQFEFGTYSSNSISDYFLLGCTSLTTPPTIPNRVTSIGNHFLVGCTSLTNPPTIPNGVTSIGDGYLGACTSLTTPPTIPNGVTIIGNDFLAECTSLTSPPTILNGVTSIGNGFLGACTSLTTPPTIPKGVTSIGDYFLYCCTSLTTPPTIPNGVTSISDCFLYECKSLTTPPTIPNGVTSIGSHFLGVCTSLTTPPTIPNGVTSIGHYFLYRCTSLTTPPTIPNGVTSIGDYFLGRCTSLTTPPTIANGVTSIDSHFLVGCTSLTTPPTIPNGVASIGNYFLAECTSLRTHPIVLNPSTKIGNNFLLGCKKQIVSINL